MAVNADESPAPRSPSSRLGAAARRLLELLREHLLPGRRAQRFGRLIVLFGLVGVGAGFGAMAFEWLTGLLRHFLLDGFAGFRPPAPAGEVELFAPTTTLFEPWKLALLPVIGGLVGGAFVHWIAPEAEGHGTDAAIDAYHRRGGRVRARVPLVKTLASALTLGTGGSAGREGPIAQIGAGLGSLLAHGLRLRAHERRALMLAGMAAGIGAIFRAPLASALFAAEVLYREMDLEFEAIVPSVIASIVAYGCFTSVFGGHALFATPAFAFASPVELVPYTALAFAVALGAKTFITGFYAVHAWFKRLKLAPPLKPALGGVFAGAAAFVAPEALGQGYGMVQAAFGGSVPLATLLVIAAFKMLTTSFTIGSGQSGGVFGPSMVLGGLVGGAVGLICQRWFPALSPPPGAFVVVGMAGFFAAAANTPLSTIIMVSELTGGYTLLVPSMWVSFLAFLLVRRSTLYPNQVARREDSPVHLAEMMAEVLARLKVAEALTANSRRSPPCVKLETPFEELRRLFSDTGHHGLPVVDAAGRLLGVVDDRALRHVMREEALANVVIAADLLEAAPTLTPSESLQSAMQKMIASGHQELVVVADDDGNAIVGSLLRQDLVAAYDRRMRGEHPDGVPPSARSNPGW
jgi:CIC family chloride channel protein